MRHPPNCVHQLLLTDCFTTPGDQMSQQLEFLGRQRRTPPVHFYAAADEIDDDIAENKLVGSGIARRMATPGGNLESRVTPQVELV